MVFNSNEGSILELHCIDHIYFIHLEMFSKDAKVFVQIYRKKQLHVHRQKLLFSKYKEHFTNYRISLNNICLTVRPFDRAQQL